MLRHRFFQYLTHLPMSLAVLILVGGLLVCASFSPANVQANPEVKSATVTATVPDNEPPTTPILVSPSNGAYVTVTKPTFVWEASTDDWGMGNYQLFIDGSIHFNNIPLTAADIPEFTLTYDSTTARYSLTPKTALSEGSHTWKIRAVDGTGNVTDSATWTFTIDTQAPIFVVTQVGDEAVSISAQDSSTIPASPIELEENQPTLSGTGEASSTIQLTVSIPGDPTQTYSATIASDGTWSINLTTLPRDVTITLDFIITDLAGNISILNGVQIVIVTPVITIPPTSPSPSPLASGEPTPPPTSPAPSPIITIPLIPPQEILEEVTQELSERLPAPIAAVINALPEEVKEVIENVADTLAPVSVAIVSGAIPVASTIAVASQFGWNISPDILIKILQALGILPVGKPRGLVFDSASYEPIPFALLTITGTSKNESPINETVVSDVNGVYKGIHLPPGKYRIDVSHQDFTFPTTKNRPSYLELSDYYRGEEFTVTSDKQEQLFLIPMDIKKDRQKRSWRTRFRLFLSRMSRRSGSMLLPLFVVSGLLATLFPTIINWLFFGIYSILMAVRVKEWFKIPIVTGTVIDTQGQPVSNVVIRLSLPETNELTGVMTTDQGGNFALFGSRSTYQLSIVKEGYIWTDGGAALSFYELNTTTGPQHLVATLEPATQIYTELFGEMETT
jgi:hypothetical protein